MRQSGLCWAWCLALSTPLCAADGIEIRSQAFTANIQAGSVVRLTDADGTQYVGPPAEARGMSLYRGESGHWAMSVESGTTLAPGSSSVQTYEAFSELDAAQAEARYELDAATGDLLIRQTARTAASGLWGVGWWIADIPLDYAILIPGGSGLRLTRETPGPTFQHDYPFSWEAQLVVVEGPQGGFYAWSDDTQGRFKRLIVERRPSGWRIGLITLNDAPFDNLTTCESVTWRLNTYTGAWRVPARRYRDWLQQTYQLVPVAQRQPAWAQNIRGCVIMGLDTDILEALPTYFDPTQTLLYLYDWRAPGYDRQYPDYARLQPALMPFLQRARALGFRTMLHVNYFGVDPQHPAFEQFAPYQVRSPWGQHDKECWIWPPEDPDIRFAYINPACRAWRDYFTAAMVELCQQTGVDALHLDQTICIFNDHNGRIDGMSMLEGNVALHRQLREALPHVALSGEGLNEVTCRYEAFAQRHAWGLDHSKSTYDRRMLAAAHPISSYILRPFTTMYGYLGCVSPENDQMYAAWNEAYRHWGIIPTLKPTREALTGEHGFLEQFSDEVRVWQQQCVEVDLDGPWPAEVAFPLRTADGQPFVATQDRRWILNDRVISQTVTGTTQWAGAGTVPGWRAHAADRVLGLHPDRWYPLFPRSPAGDRFHVCDMPADTVIDFIAVSDQLALVALQDVQPIVADLTTLLEHALCGTRPAQGALQERIGPGEFSDGASLTSAAGVFTTHPPWKAGVTGEAFARFTCTLPDQGRLRFISEVYMDPAAVGPDKTDGATFIVRASSDRHHADCLVHHATDRLLPLELDLSDFRGQTVQLELAVHPGPQQSFIYDWARWRRPRIERHLPDPRTIAVETDHAWTLALNADGAMPVTQTGTRLALQTRVPGTLALLAQQPPVATLPVDLSRMPDETFFVTDSGRVVDSSYCAVVQTGVNAVGGQTRRGLYTHPPNNGRTIAAYLLTLPATPARFTTALGLRDGSKSAGVEVSIAVNGQARARRMIHPGNWDMLDVDLTAWAGMPIVLSLVTDAAGGYDYDWTAWGEPQIVAQ